MTRLTVIFGLLLILIFALTLSLIHMQPHDDSELRAALLGDDCGDSVCFIGIHPGRTERGELLDILYGHEWVGHVTPGDSVITWRWSGTQPAWMDGDWPGRAGMSMAIFINEFQPVTNIEIRTTLPVANGMLALGSPTGRVVSARGGLGFGVLGYHEHNIMLTAPLLQFCRVTWLDVYETTMTVEYVSQVYMERDPTAGFPC
jgi:hypothetical protein